MILQNNSQTLITINTTPVNSSELSRINIPPNESREIPDEFCQGDFVRNLIQIGELSNIGGISAVTPVVQPAPVAPVVQPAPVAPVTPAVQPAPVAQEASTDVSQNMPSGLKKNQREALEKAREDAILLGVAYEDSWNATEVKKAIKEAAKSK